MKKLFLIPLSIFAILMFACAGETEVVEENSTEEK